MYQYKAIFSSFNGVTTGSLLSFWGSLLSSNLPFYVSLLDRPPISQNPESGAFNMQNVLSFVIYANDISDLRTIISDNPTYSFVAVVYRSSNGQKYYDIPFDFLT